MKHLDLVINCMTITSVFDGTAHCAIRAYTIKSAHCSASIGAKCAHCNCLKQVCLLYTGEYGSLWRELPHEMYYAGCHNKEARMSFRFIATVNSNVRKLTFAQ